MNNIITGTILKTVGLYILALILSRLMKGRIISQMTFFEFVVGISMGSMVANAAFGSRDISLSASIALIVLSLLAVITGYVNIKSFKGRKMLSSEPITLIKNGTIIERNMKKSRIAINELMAKLREKNAFNLADVEYAIMETDGELSVLPKADKQPLTPGHINIKTESSGFVCDIIIDGKTIDDNLTAEGLNKEWLDSKLGSQGIKDVSEVFYAGIDDNGKLIISRKKGRE